MQRIRVPAGLAIFLCALAVACDKPSRPELSDVPRGSDVPVASGAALADGAVVAEVEGTTYTLEDVDARVRKDQPGIFRELFDARARAIDEMIEDKLIEDAATKAGISSEALLEREVDEKVAAVDEAAVRAFFDTNTDAMGGQTFEAISPRIRQYLEAQAKGERRRAYIGSLKDGASFKSYLEPMRTDVVVGDADRVKGAEDAPITIVEYADFQCPFCARVRPTLARIEAEYGPKVRFVYRDYPLPMHADARPAAEAGLCANEQGKFWAFHDKAFENTTKLKPADLERLAGEIGLDVPSFKTCVESGKFKDAVAEQEKRGSELGVTGTPAFFVNGRFLSGAQPFEKFQELIDDELRRR